MTAPNDRNNSECKETRARHLVDAVYHRMMFGVTRPQEVRYVEREHTHVDPYDTPGSVCMWCVTHQPSESAHLDTLIAEAITENAHVSTTVDEGDVPETCISIESRLARSSQRKAISEKLGGNWYLYLPIAYDLTTLTPAELVKRASTIPPSIVPSHTATHLAIAVFADIAGIPSMLPTSPSHKNLVNLAARLIESRLHPYVAHRALPTTTPAKLEHTTVSLHKRGGRARQEPPHHVTTPAVKAATANAAAATTHKVAAATTHKAAAFAPTSSKNHVPTFTPAQRAEPFPPVLKIEGESDNDGVAGSGIRTRKQYGDILRTLPLNKAVALVASTTPLIAQQLTSVNSDIDTLIEKKHRLDDLTPLFDTANSLLSDIKHTLES